MSHLDAIADENPSSPDVAAHGREELTELAADSESLKQPGRHTKLNLMGLRATSSNEILSHDMKSSQHTRDRRRTNSFA